MTLCSYRTVSRRISLLLLKEVRSLHETLQLQVNIREGGASGRVGHQGGWSVTEGGASGRVGHQGGWDVSEGGVSGRVGHQGGRGVTEGGIPVCV